MSTAFPIVIAVVLAAVVLTLLLGVFSMARGGEFNKKHGNKLMRYRVLFQGLAILLLFLLWAATRG